jgi:aryl-alcohol dehydrogenase-like predicted oxidoreductase
MIQRSIAGEQVNPLGLGCMGMSEFYGPTDDDHSLETLKHAFELGVRHFDTADMYGVGHNEKLLGQFIKLLGRDYDNIFLATKCGIERNPENLRERKINGHPNYVKKACDASLKRLGVDHVSLYYLHRVDPQIPIEETVGAMGELVAAGKVRALGLSEASPDTIKRAWKEQPIAAIQSEYSLWTRDVEQEILPLCREKKMAFVAYSPLGRGFLTARIRSRQQLTDSDFRRNTPRFSDDNFQANLKMADRLSAFAAVLHCTPAQLCIAWVLAQGDFLHAIPGTKHIKYLEENYHALDVHLSLEDLAVLDEVAPPGAARGERYPAETMKTVNR